MNKIWVLSMCMVEEGGGSALPAELYATEQDGIDAVNRYAVDIPNWGCVDWSMEEVELPKEI